MPKRSGLGANCYVDGINLSGDIGAIDTLASPRGTFVVTGIDKSAYERILGRRDGLASFTAFFNKDANRAHLKLSPLPRTDRDAMVLIGTTLGDPAASLRALQINYDGTREQEGQFLFKIDMQSQGFGLDWGRMLTAGRRTDTGATNGSSVDFGTGSTAFGLTAWLQVLGFTGTDATIKLQESSDNGGADAFADVTGGGFVSVTTAPGTQRIATSTTQTIERYLRVVTTTTGGFSSLEFAVMVARHEAAVVL
jgi:hypothetical protein